MLETKAFAEQSLDFSAPAERAAREYVGVVEQVVEERSHGGVPPVGWHGAERRRAGGFGVR